jgi:hypothetical protein
MIAVGLVRALHSFLDAQAKIKSQNGSSQNQLKAS